MEVYLDNAATTKVSKDVVLEMTNALKNIYGNPSSVHFKGTEAQEEIDKVRKIIAKKINAEAKEIIFTSGGSEGNNFCIKGIVKASKKKHIITSKIEHASVLNTCKQLELDGFKVTYIDVDKNGLVNPKDVEKAIKKDTALVTIMHANNEIGTIQDIEKIGKICKKHKVLFHTDAVQSFLKEKIDAKYIDALTISAHKFHGPKGVGAVYLRQGMKVDKLIEGGKQEFNLRGGTQNVPGIIGMGKAVELWKENKMKDLRDYMIKRILTEIPGTKLNGHKTKRLANNINISFDDVEGEVVMLHLSYLNVAVGTGSACHEKMIKVSHVLHAIGLDKKSAIGAVRFTLSPFTTKKEVDFAIEKLKTVVQTLRKVKT
ncbi:cysteine desulfurase [Candidatus Woesearchaeota archaeon]|nr:MAG: cysteine desulfurase [Candidatus Woesearchaeota archaeon]